MFRSTVTCGVTLLLQTRRMQYSGSVTKCPAPEVSLTLHLTVTFAAMSILLCVPRSSRRRQGESPAPLERPPLASATAEALWWTMTGWGLRLYRTKFCARWLLALVIFAMANDQPAIAQSKTSRGRSAVAFMLDGGIRTVDVRAFTCGEITCKDEVLPATRVYRLDLNPAKVLVPDRPADVIVQLVNGDELHLRRVTSDDESLKGTLGDETIDVPLEYTRGMAFVGGKYPTPRQIPAAFSDETEAKDVVFLNDRDQVVGEFLALEKNVLRIDADAFEKAVPRDRIVFLRFNSQLLSPIPSADVRTIVELTNGTVLTASKVTADPAGQVRMRSEWGATVATSWRHVRSVRFISEQVQPLSSLPLTTSTHKPFAGRKRKHLVGRTIRGDHATHLGKRYFSSLGVTSGMNLTWQLDGSLHTFQSRFGIDDSAPHGAAVFVVLVDGIERFRSGIVKSRRSVGTTGPIDLTGAETLTLAVEYGPRGDVQDVANWLDPILVRK